MKLRSKLLFAGVVVGGVAVFASSSSPTGLSEVADVPQVYSPPVNYDTSDGLRVQTIRLNADRRTVNIRLNQSDHSKMSIAYGIELSTDRGESVLPPSAQETFLLYSNEPKSLDLHIPAELRDGYYILRMTGAAFAGGHSQIFEHAFFFASMDSSLMEVSADEFYSYSGMNQAFVVTAIEGDAP